MSRALEEQRPHLFGFLSYSHVTKQCLQQHIYLFYQLANNEQAVLQKKKKNTGVIYISRNRTYSIEPEIITCRRCACPLSRLLVKIAMNSTY